MTHSDDYNQLYSNYRLFYIEKKETPNIKTESGDTSKHFFTGREICSFLEFWEALQEVQSKSGSVRRHLVR